MKEEKCQACKGKGKGYHLVRTGKRNKITKQTCSWCRGNKKQWRTSHAIPTDACT